MDTILLLSTVAWLLTWWDGRQSPLRVRGVWWWWVGCLVLLTANQLVLSAHFVAAGVPPWTGRFPGVWFAMWDGPVVHWLAEVVGGTPGLSTAAGWSLLRVNAVLELPFALLAFLAAGQLVGASAPRPLTVAATCAGWTAVFWVLETWLHNPLTDTDLVLRVASAAGCAAVYPLLLRDAEPAGGLRLGGLAVAVTGLVLHAAIIVCFAFLTLAYNPVHFRWLGVLMAPAGLALAVAVHSLPRLQAPIGPLDRAARTFAALLLPVAIPLRYAWPSPLAQAVLALICVAAVGVAVRHQRWWVSAACAPAALVVAATDAGGLLAGPWRVWPDLLMLQRAALFITTWVLVRALLRTVVDRLPRAETGAGHPGDEARVS